MKPVPPRPPRAVAAWFYLPLLVILGFTSVDYAFPLQDAVDHFEQHHNAQIRICTGLFFHWSSKEVAYKRLFIMVPYSLASIKMVGLRWSSVDGASYMESRSTLLLLLAIYAQVLFRRVPGRGKADRASSQKPADGPE